MSTKRQITETGGIYFITITCYQWLPLIEQRRAMEVMFVANAESPGRETPLGKRGSSVLHINVKGSMADKVHEDAARVENGEKNSDDGQKQLDELYRIITQWLQKK